MRFLKEVAVAFVGVSVFIGLSIVLLQALGVDTKKSPAVSSCDCSKKATPETPKPTIIEPPLANIDGHADLLVVTPSGAKVYRVTADRTPPFILVENKNGTITLK